MRPRIRAKVHDFVRKVDTLAADRRRFYLSPDRWRSSRVTVALKWKRVKFCVETGAGVPADRGIYAFVVQHENGHFPPNAYVMYIGITGAVSENRNLRLRYMDYVNEQTKNKRPKVHYMLNKYYEDLFFHYVALTDKELDLEALELDLNDAVLPPVVVKDFTAEVRDLVKALAE